MAERYTATLDHESWAHARTFVADDESAAERRAEAFLLGVTNDTRDWDEYQDNDDWVEVCLGEDWSITIGILVE